MFDIFFWRQGADDHERREPLHVSDVYEVLDIVYDVTFLDQGTPGQILRSRRACPRIVEGGPARRGFPSGSGGGNQMLQDIRIPQPAVPVAVHG